ncbi:uncharacterized protein BDV14DRAFT_203114 [Aspergillus stella-maris]|uniref:uncharacterized protein n=1 Tax=Aspergillus stella-maris TaxID=1810926 RepID=UPI003CCD232E
MTAIIQRIRRKRKVSSELDSRWGDVAISSPNEGSWSQYGGGSARTSPVSFDHGRGHGPKQNPGDHSHSYIYTNGAAPSESPKEMSPNSLNMPTGYYDAKLRRQAKTKSRPPKAQPVQPKHITLPKAWEEKKFGDNPADEAGDDVCSLGSPRGRRGTDDANSRGSKSPPLSVTSRMRRFSSQSTGTEPIFSVPGTASSQRTSFSVDDPRLARHTPHHDKKTPPPLPLGLLPQTQVQRNTGTDTSTDTNIKVHNAGPIPASQELVPSYDDLYG